MILLILFSVIIANIDTLSVPPTIETTIPTTETAIMTTEKQITEIPITSHMPEDLRNKTDWTSTFNSSEYVATTYAEFINAIAIPKADAENLLRVTSGVDELRALTEEKLIETMKNTKPEIVREIYRQLHL
ncbi:uncharacterized protein LOC135841126 [Planococcus citri]|uniref:uncharacterized protein LOC135841126 n=1 Tax=Planococcus citri TaxID=170843 RepID=UPI0031F723E6